jgi:hypothetical protein
MMSMKMMTMYDRTTVRSRVDRAGLSQHCDDDDDSGGNGIAAADDDDDVENDGLRIVALI